MTYARPANSQRPHDLQCWASIFPAATRASAAGLFMVAIPSGRDNASRIGPTSFFPHHSLVWRALALVRNALHISCIVTTGTVQLAKTIFSIAPNPRQTRADVKSAHGTVQQQHCVVSRFAQTQVANARTVFIELLGAAA